LWDISPPPQLIEEIRQKCGVDGPFGLYGNERNKQRLDSCVIRSADLYQDFVAELFGWLEGYLPYHGIKFAGPDIWPPMSDSRSDDSAAREPSLPARSGLSISGWPANAAQNFDRQVARYSSPMPPLPSGETIS
jgi:hypothetical protein